LQRRKYGDNKVKEQKSFTEEKNSCKKVFGEKGRSGIINERQEGSDVLHANQT
jgi:hypothetical protein